MNLFRASRVFYCVPAQTYESMMDHIEDLELLTIFEQHKNQASIKDGLDDI